MHCRCESRTVFVPRDRGPDRRCGSEALEPVDSVVFVLSDIIFSFVSLEFPTANTAALRHENRSGPAGALALRTSGKLRRGTGLHKARRRKIGRGRGFLLAGPAMLRKCQARRPGARGGLKANKDWGDCQKTKHDTRIGDSLCHTETAIVRARNDESFNLARVTAW